MYLCSYSLLFLALFLVERSYAPPGTGQYAAAYANVDLKFEDVAGVDVSSNLVAMHVPDHKRGYLAIVGVVTGLDDGKYQVEVHSGYSCHRTGGPFNPVKVGTAQLVQCLNNLILVTYLES